MMRRASVQVVDRLGYSLAPENGILQLEITASDDHVTIWIRKNKRMRVAFQLKRNRDSDATVGIDLHVGRNT